uniref:Uncharacterized protein n=1 Tax=Arundo donax TaxID=35708 RepID=A0A0A9AH08_ARUDO
MEHHRELGERSRRSTARPDSPPLEYRQD